MLDRLGYDPGPADGLLGRRTGAAVVEYRADHGLPRTVAVDERLLEHLRARIREAERGGAITYRSADRAPVVESGDVFVYSDGTVETVQRRVGSRVWWQRRDGAEYLGFANFLLPRWRRDGSPSEPPRIDADPESLWPLSDGTPVMFEVTMPQPADEPSNGSVLQEWRCAVTGKRRIDVPAGRVDTLVIGCERNPAPPGRWQHRTWYYSPALGHYVRVEDRLADGSREPARDLVAIRPGAMGWPPAARAGLDWALQEALENGPGGEPTEWTSSGVDVSFQMRVLPGKAGGSGSGPACLSYTQRRGPESRFRLYAGLACRDAVTGRWAVPFLGTSDAVLTPTSR